MNLSDNNTELFRAEFTEMLYRYAEQFGMSLCQLTDVCLLELAKHHVVQERGVEEGLAHLSGHLDLIQSVEPDTLH